MQKKKTNVVPFVIAGILIAGALLAVFFSSRSRQKQTIMNTAVAVAEATETALYTPPPTETPTELPTATRTARPTSEGLNYEVFAPTETPELGAAQWKEWPVVPNEIRPEMRVLYQEGLAAGNDPKRFSKVGDSNTVMPSFMGCFDISDGGYVLGVYKGLQQVIDQFQWSFSRNSRAARDGASAYDLDVYHWYTDDVCWPYESATTCEYRLFTPSIAIIALGTNDALMDINIYEEHLRSLVQKTLDRKIVPILATKADNLEINESFNRVTVQVAEDFGIPLWNLWRAMSTLPNQGLKQGDVHPTANDVNLCDFSGSDLSNYGWTVRNLSALQALDRVWRLLNEMPLDSANES